MTSNNFERMKIVLSLNQFFDYVEFLQICESKGIFPLSLNEYAMKAGYIMMAKIKYPDIPIEDAYMLIIKESNEQPVGTVNNNTSPASGCSGCGGGKVV